MIYLQKNFPFSFQSFPLLISISQDKSLWKNIVDISFSVIDYDNRDISHLVLLRLPPVPGHLLLPSSPWFLSISGNRSIQLPWVWSIILKEESKWCLCQNSSWSWNTSVETAAPKITFAVNLSCHKICIFSVIIDLYLLMIIQPRAGVCPQWFCSYFLLPQVIYLVWAGGNSPVHSLHSGKVKFHFTEVG